MHTESGLKGLNAIMHEWGLLYRCKSLLQSWNPKGIQKTDQKRTLPSSGERAVALKGQHGEGQRRAVAMAGSVQK